MPDAKATFALVGQDQTSSAFTSALANLEGFAAKAQEILKGAFALEGVSIAADFVKSSAELGASLESGAVRAGIAQGTFNQLAAAFNEADISAESLSKGIKNMQVAISSATNGNDTIAAAFNEIGLSATSLKQLSPDVQLLAIAEALSKISDPADRARLGAQVLGKQFLELEPQLLKGAEGLGAIVNAAHGMNDEDTARLAKFNEQMNALGQTLKLFAAGTVSGTVSVFQRIGDAFSPELLAKIAAFQAALGNTGSATTLNLLSKSLAAMQAQAEDLKNKSAAPNIAAAMSEQGKGQIEAASTEILKLLLDQHTAEEDMDMKAAAARSAQLDAEFKDTQTHGEKRVAFEAQVDDLVAAHRITAYEGLKRIFAPDEAASNASADAAAKASNSGAIEASIQATQKQFSESTDAMAAKSKLLTENMAADWNKTKENAAQAANAIEDSFATFLVDPFSGGLKKMLSAWVQTIDQMVAKAAAQSIFKSLFGDAGLSSIFSAFLTGGSGFTPTYDASPGAASALLDGHATGASWKVGGSGGTDSQLVRFRASPDENVSVTRPGQSAGGGGDVHMHNTYNIGSGVSRTDVIQACAETQKSTIAKVTQLIRGGAFG